MPADKSIDWSQWEAVPDAAPDQGPAPSPSLSPNNPAVAPSGPGFLSRLGKAISYLPPVAIVGRGLQNMVSPFTTAANAATTAAPVAAQWFKDVAAPEMMSEAGQVASPILQGARNLGAPFIPTASNMLSSVVGGPQGAAAWGNVFNPRPGPPQDNPPAGPIGLTVAPQNPASRIVGKIYQTPRGPKKWMGSFWIDLT